MGIKTSEVMTYFQQLQKAKQWVAQHKSNLIVSLKKSFVTLGDLASLAQYVENDSAVYWRDPACGQEQFAFGVAHSVESNSYDPIRDLQHAWHDCSQHVFADDLSDVRFFLGFSFDPRLSISEKLWAGWPHGWLLLPRYRAVRDASGACTMYAYYYLGEDDAEQFDIDQALADFDQITAAWVTKSRMDSLPVSYVAQEIPNDMGRAAWKKKVEDAVSTIVHGDLAKVVLARHATVETKAHFAISETLQTLREQFPESAVFGVFRDGAVFAGASPERLVHVQDHGVAVDCLAGTTRRSPVPDEDATLAYELLRSQKNRHEHQMVIDGVRQALNGVVSSIQIADEPTIKKLSNVQHLYTPVKGLLAPGYDAFSLVKRLHPTPAVAGLPKQAALFYLADHEELARGWYAAPIGFVDAAGNLDCYVGLRSALIQGNRAELFAGAGITADSDPELEYVETMWKMNPMREALHVVSVREGL